VRRDAHPNHARCRAVTGQHCRVRPSTTRAQTSGIGRGHSTKVSDEDTREARTGRFRASACATGGVSITVPRAHPAPAETPSPEPEQQLTPAVTEWIDHRSGDAAPGEPRGRAMPVDGCHPAPSVQDYQWLPGIEKGITTPRYAIVRADTGWHRD